MSGTRLSCACQKCQKCEHFTLNCNNLLKKGLSSTSGAEPDWATLCVGILRNGGAKDQADDGSELHHNVQCWPRSILQRVTNSVSGHSVLVRCRALAVIGANATSLDVLLRVVPGATCVAH